MNDTPNITEEILTSPNIDFASLIADAPDESLPPTEEWLEAERKAKKAAVESRILSADAGWPSKALWDVQNVPIHGEQWIAAYTRAFEAIKNGGIVALHGRRGGGKTRMAAELAIDFNGGTYRKAMKFFLDVRATYGQSMICERDVVDELIVPNLLILDEIQVRGDKPFEDRLLTHLIDDRYAERRPTIIIANLNREELAESLGASVVDRVRESGAVIEFTWPSFRANPVKP